MATCANKPVRVRVYAGESLWWLKPRLLQNTAGFALGIIKMPARRYMTGGITWRHYLAVIQRKPGALRNGAPFSELPDCFKRLQGILLKRLGGDRAMANMLALVLHHDEHWLRQAVEAAAERPTLSAAGDYCAGAIARKAISRAT